MKNQIGIIITAGEPVGILTRYHAQLHTGTAGSFPLESATLVAETAARATALFQKHFEKNSPRWACGSGACKKTAKKLGMKFRLKAPGAGRPKKPEGTHAVALNAWVKPEELRLIKSAAAREKTPIGATIAARFPKAET